MVILIILKFSCSSRVRLWLKIDFMQEKIGVVLLNLGGPDSLDAVEPFLYNLFVDPDIINFPGSFLFREWLAKFISSKRHPKIQEQYKQIGGKSPLKDFTLGQAAMLEEKLNEHFPAKVYAAMRYWHPFTEEVLDELENENITKVVLLPLYPQYSMATTESSVKEWKKHLEQRESKIEWTLVEHYYDFPPYVDACVERVNQGLEKFAPDIRDQVDIVIQRARHADEARPAGRPVFRSHLRNRHGGQRKGRLEESAPLVFSIKGRTAKMADAFDARHDRRAGERRFKI